MAKTTGRFSFSSTGSQTIVTGLTGAPTFATVYCGGKSGDTTNHGSTGTMDGTRQNVQYWSPTVTGTSNTDVIWMKDASGTTLLKASWTSFGTSGGSGTVTFNVSTLDTGFQPTLVVEN